MGNRYPTVFVANDAVLDQTVAFLQSISTNSPDLTLICIPYDGMMERIRSLRRVFRFDIAPLDISDAMAALSVDLYGTVIRRLVKLSCFDLDEDEFLFLDTDILVLQDLRPLFGSTSPDAAIVFADESRSQCYTRRDHPRLADAREFNTGVFVSSRRWLTTDVIVTAVRDQLSLYRDVAFLQNDDQPILNFAVDMRRLQARDFDECGLPYSSHTWFLKDNQCEKDGRLIDANTGKPLPLIHFAGHGHQGLENASRHAPLYRQYHSLGCRRAGLTQDPKRDALRDARARSLS